MIDHPRTPTVQPAELRRDERSMRLVEYALAMMALASALLLSLR
jgi:hypothetical protein